MLLSQECIQGVVILLFAWKNILTDKRMKEGLRQYLGVFKTTQNIVYMLLRQITGQIDCHLIKIEAFYVLEVYTHYFDWMLQEQQFYNLREKITTLLIKHNLRLLQPQMLLKDRVPLHHINDNIVTLDAYNYTFLELILEKSNEMPLGTISVLNTVKRNVALVLIKYLTQFR